VSLTELLTGISYYGRVRGTADSPSPKGWGLKHTCRRPRHVNIHSANHLTSSSAGFKNSLNERQQRVDYNSNRITYLSFSKSHWAAQPYVLESSWFYSPRQLNDNWTLLEIGYRLVCGCDRYYGWMRWIGRLTIETPDHFASWDEGLDASRTTIQAGRNKSTKGWHITSIVSDQLPHWAGFWKQCQSVIVAQCPRTICVGDTYPFPTQSLGQIKLGLMSWYRTTWIRWIEKISVSNSFDLRSTCIVPISIIQTSVSYYPILANPLSSTQFCRSFSNSDHTASIQHPAPCLSCLVLTA